MGIRSFAADLLPSALHGLQRATPAAARPADGQAFSASFASLADRLNTGWEMRGVDCVETWNYNNGNIYVARTDTYEMIEERPMDPEERQMGLFPEKKEEAPTTGGSTSDSDTPGVEGAEATPEPPKVVEAIFGPVPVDAPGPTIVGEDIPVDKLPEDSNPFYAGEKKTKWEG